MLQLQLVKSLGFKGVSIGRYCMYLIGNLNAFFFFSLDFVGKIPNTPANENILPIIYLNILLLFYRIYFVVFH